MLRRFLDKKVTKTQGLELMSDKFVKALLVISTSSDEGVGKGALTRFMVIERRCKSFNVLSIVEGSPSIISYADSRVQIAGRIGRDM